MYEIYRRITFSENYENEFSERINPENKHPDFQPQMVL
jgi:hypothetical protein